MQNKICEFFQVQASELDKKIKICGKTYVLKSFKPAWILLYLAEALTAVCGAYLAVCAICLH